MSEGVLGRVVEQRDLLGHVIQGKIPRSVQIVPVGQIALDRYIEELSYRPIKIEIVRQEETTDRKGSSKRRPWGKLIIDKDGRDEHTLVGRYYTPDPGKEAWSLPAERRDASPKVRIEQGNVVFQIRGRDVWENGIRWAKIIVLEKTEKGETPRIRGHGYMMWADINAEDKKTE